MSFATEAESESRNDGETILEVRNAEVTFEMSRGRAKVLDDVNLEIKRGETIGIAGESGCGKSMFGATLMNAVENPGKLTGDVIYYPEWGDPVNIAELEYGDLRKIRWEDIAMVYQGSMNSFNPSTNMRSHFHETLDAHRADIDEGMERAHEILRTLNLDPERILDSYGHEISGGEAQRVLLSMSLLLDPEIVIMDEPTSALDLLMERKMIHLIKEIKEEYDLTVVFISHDFPTLAGIVDRIAIMYAFEIVELGSVDDVLLDAQHPYTRMMLGATLGMDTAVEQAQSIEGQPPDPVNVPTGCPFHPRCPVSDDRCEVEEPALVSEADSDHSAACFYPDIAQREIDSNLEDEDEWRERRNS